jgi:hypothetical protein
MLRREPRLWDWRNRVSLVESWYLSANIEDGSVTNACSLQAPVEDVVGIDMPSRAMESFIVGCKPVGVEKLVLYVDDSGRR